MKLIYICIPTFNEAANIDILFDKIQTAIGQIPNYEIRILVIDDNSPDHTAKRVSEYKEKKEIPVEIILNERKLGLGNAYIKGFKHAMTAGAFAIVMMDADLSHDPSFLPQLIGGLDEVDIVIGSRYIKGGGVVNWGLKRQILSKFGNLYSRLILLSPIKDLTGGFNCYKTECLKAINLDEIKSNGYSFQIELKYRLSKRFTKIKEIPIIFKDRNLGTSKLDGSIILEAIFTPWKLLLRH